VGTLIFDLVGRHKCLLPIEAPGTCEITAFGRRSLSLHALKNLGYSCGHEFLETGNILWIKTDAGDRIDILLTTFKNRDYACIRLHLPGTATNSVNTLHVATGVPDIMSVHYLDITKHMSGTSLYTLLHLWYGIARVAKQ
jgi:hypothetical protein